MRFWKTGLAVLALCSAGAIGVAAASQGQIFQWNDDSDATQVFELSGRGGSRIGASIADVSADDVQARKLTSESGAIIRDVDDDMPAAKAGIKAGDVIVEYDGERVRSARQLTRLVQETPSGRKVPTVVTRDGTRMTFTLAPEAATTPSVHAFSAPRAPRSPRPPRAPRAPRAPSFDHDFEMPELPEMPEMPDMPDMPDMPLPRVFAMPRMEIFGGGRLGVSIQSLSDQMATYFGVDDGVLVTEVDEDSAASKAGFKAGDVITRINGTVVEDTGGLMRELSDAERDVTIEIVRDKKTQTLKATLDEQSSRRRSVRRII